MSSAGILRNRLPAEPAQTGQKSAYIRIKLEFNKPIIGDAP